MKVTLAITVGGSADPIVTSLVHHRPRFTLFFVTDRPRGGSQATLADIATKAVVAGGTYRTIVLSHPDDFASCYRAMRDAMRQVQDEFGEGSFIADYTGGTKTMTAALAAAAVHLGWKLSLVEAYRDDLDRAHLAGVPTLQSRSPVVLDDVLERVRVLYKVRNHEGAATVLTTAMKDLALDPEPRSALVRAVNLFTGLAHWDRFEYGQAYEHLQACGEVCPDLLPHLARLDAFEREKTQPPYELVWDLLASGEGRAVQGQYEDAVLRLYRAVELLAQVRLARERRLDTGDLDLARVPEPLRGEFAARVRAGSKVTAGLLDAYRILAALGDPLGKVFASWEERLRDLLLLRNKAFIEHGFTPLGEAEWTRARKLAAGFLEEGARAVGLRWQVPSPPAWEALEALFGP